MAFLLAAAASPAGAQVGHAPGQSPYREIAKAGAFTGTVWRFGGDGGSLGMAPHDGAVFGLRYDFRANATLQFGVGVAFGELERKLVDPFVTRATRVRGPIKQNVTFGEASLQLNLTGGKSWHRLAPYLAVTGGLALAGTVEGDTSGFAFKTKAYVAPAIGTRLFVSDRLYLLGDARLLFWSLSYPEAFAAEPPDDPGTVDDPHAVIPGGADADLSEWVATPVLRVGLGYSFRF